MSAVRLISIEHMTWLGTSKRSMPGMRDGRSKQDSWTKKMPSFGLNTAVHNAVGHARCPLVGKSFPGQFNTIRISIAELIDIYIISATMTQKGCYAETSQNEETRGCRSTCRVSQLTHVASDKV